MMNLRKWQKKTMMTATNVVTSQAGVDETLNDEELKRWAEEYDMSVEDFKKYMNFFYRFAE